MRSPRRASVEHISEYGAGGQIVQQLQEKDLDFFQEFFIPHSQHSHGRLEQGRMVDLMLSAPDGSGTVSSGATARSGQTQHSKESVWADAALPRPHVFCLQSSPL